MFGEKTSAARVRKANRNNKKRTALIKTVRLSRCGGTTRALHEPHAEFVVEITTFCNVSIAKETKKCKSPSFLHCKSLNNDYF